MSTRNFDQAQGIQRRTFTAELRAVGDEYALIGYAAMFNNLSKDLGGFREKISPGAFTRSLREGADVMCLFNHAVDNVLGRTKSGTLTLSEDDRGLKYRCQLDRSNPLHQQVYASIKRGDISTCSFAFTVPVGGDLWEGARDSDSAYQLRTLLDVDLIDCSPVTYPAYDNTAVGARQEMGRQKFGYSKKSPVEFPVDSVMLFRQALQSNARVLINETKRKLEALSAPYAAPYNYDSLRQHLEMCSSMSECAYATASTVEDLLDNWPSEDDENDSRGVSGKIRTAHQAFRAAHRQSHVALGIASMSLAETLLHLGRVTNKTTSKNDHDGDN